MRKIASAIVGAVLRLLIRIISSADTGNLQSVPDTGPLIIIFNHVNFLEVPLLYLRLRPRKLHYMAKSETWKNPFMGWMAENWHTIRVKRGGNPLEAFDKAGKVLEQGHILLISPEGTRSGNGILRGARDGTVLLALHNNAVIIPVGHTGAENIRKNMRRLRRTRVKYRIGRPFRLNGSDHPDKDRRKRLTDAMMHELAVLLPMEQRGIYGDLPFNPELLEYVE